MLWSKQYYYFDVDSWLKEREAHPLVGPGAQGRAQRRVVPHVQRRHHLDARQVGVPLVRRLGPGLPHLALSLVDFDFAKEQLLLMLRSLYAHPNGQIPAYEWNFSDVNPPVHAWATLFLYQRARRTSAARTSRSWSGRSRG